MKKFRFFFQKIVVDLGRNMADKLFALEGPKELKAITINGAVHVESEEERERKRAERAMKRNCLLYTSPSPRDS